MPIVDTPDTSPDRILLLYTDPVNALLLEENIVAGSAGVINQIASYNTTLSEGGISNEESIVSKIDTFGGVVI